MILAELLLRTLAALWLVTGTALASYAIAWQLLRRCPATVRWLGTCLVGIWLATVGFHVLAALHWFTLGAGLLAVGGLAATAIACSADVGQVWRRDRRALRFLTHRLRSSPYRGIATAVFVCAVPVMVRPLFTPPMAWDTATYHALKAGMWVKYAGQLHMQAPGPWAVYAERWGGAELLMAWAMLPFHGEFLAVSGEVVQWLALGLAVMTLARQLGAREPYASSAAALVMATPTMRLLVGSGYTEPLQCLCFMACLVFGVRCFRRPCFSMLLFGLAAAVLQAGAKMTSLNIAAVLGGLLVLQVLVARSFRTQPGCSGKTATVAGPGASLWRRVGWLVVAASAAAITVVPWMIAPYRRTGLPLSPLPVTIAGYPLGEAAPEAIWYMDRPEAKLMSVPWTQEYRNIIELVFGWAPENESLRAPLLLPLGLAPIGLLALARRSPRAAFFVGCGAAVAVFAYFDPRLQIVRRMWTVSSSRFLLPAVSVAVPLSILWCRESADLGRVYLRMVWTLTIAFLLLTTTIGVSSTSIKALVVFPLCLSIFAWILMRTARPAPRIAILILAILVLYGFQRNVRSRILTDEFVAHSIKDYWTGAAISLDEPSRPYRIAVTSGPERDADNWFAAPFLGSKLQNEVLYISPLADGSIPHFGLGPWQNLIQRNGDADAWVQRLRAAHVTHVFSFSPPSVELEWMRSRPAEFVKLQDAKTWGLYQVVPSRADARHPPASSE